MMLRHDLRYALRLTRRDWRFTATLVATLADGGVLLPTRRATQTSPADVMRRKGNAIKTRCAA